MGMHRVVQHSELWPRMMDDSSMDLFKDIVADIPVRTGNLLSTAKRTRFQIAVFPSYRISIGGPRAPYAVAVRNRKDYVSPHIKAQIVGQHISAATERHKAVLVNDVKQEILRQYRGF